MYQRPVFLLGIVLLSVAVTFNVAVIGQDVAPGGVKVAVPGANKDVSKPAVHSNAKPGDKPGTKPIADTVEKKSLDQAGSVSLSADEEAILLTGATYVKAYADANAKAIAAHFTTDAEYIDEQGNAYQGREAIEAAMKLCFTENPNGQIELDINSIRVISPGVAIEDGTTMITRSDDSEPIRGRYTAVHVKSNGKWLVASVREQAPKERRLHRAQLQQLAWMKGDWVDEGDDSVILFSCDTIDGGNFLLRKFIVQIAGQEAMSGSQRIGWDPVSGKLRAWTFDSEGGYTDGFWHRDEDRWVLKSFGVTADGQTASSTAIYTYVDENTMTWQSVDHEIAGVELPDSKVVTIVRRAPPPEMAEEVTLKTK